MQKIIARAGIASRRHAEELIRSGQVSVNGVVVTELGAKADPEKDRVEAAGRLAEQPGQAGYFILNKPQNVVSTMSDPEGRATLRHLLRGQPGGLFPVGRLDYAATGLILMTSDGKLADSIFKIALNLVQVYWIKLKGRPSQDTLSSVGHKSQARLRLLRSPDAVEGRAENPWYEAEVRGWKRRDILRQAFFDAGHPVEKMKRVQLGPLELGALPESEYRQLTPSEVESLRHAIEKASQISSAPLVSAHVPREYERKQWRAKEAKGKEAQEEGPRPPFRPSREGGEREFRPGPKRPFEPRRERPDGERRGPARFRPAAEGGPRSGKPGAPGRFDRGGERRFPAGGERKGPGGFRRTEGGPPGRNRGEGTFSPSGPRPGGFRPSGPRPGGPRDGEFRGSRPPGRPPDRPFGRPSGGPGSRPTGRPGGRQSGPSERSGGRPFSGPGGRPSRPSGGPGGRPGGPSRSGGRPFSGPGGRPSRPSGGPGGRPGGPSRSGGRPSRPSGGGRPGGRPSGRPGGRPGKPPFRSGGGSNRPPRREP